MKFHVCVILQGGSNMTGTDVARFTHKSVPVIFEPPCIYSLQVFQLRPLECALHSNTCRRKQLFIDVSDRVEDFQIPRGMSETCRERKLEIRSVQNESRQPTLVNPDCSKTEESKFSHTGKRLTQNITLPVE